MSTEMIFELAWYCLGTESGFDYRLREMPPLICVE